MNEPVIAGIFCLVCGAALGYITARVHYEKKRDEDIELAVHNFKMEYLAQLQKEKEEQEALKKVEEDISKAKEVVEETATSLGYIPSQEDIAEEKEDDVVKKSTAMRSVRYISPSELDDSTDYEVIRYTWNKDASLKREEDDEVITDIDEMLDEVGLDFRERFKDLSVQTVYIRDDTLEYDYVIERNLRSEW